MDAIDLKRRKGSVAYDADMDVLDFEGKKFTGAFLRSCSEEKFQGYVNTINKTKDFIIKKLNEMQAVKIIPKNLKDKFGAEAATRMANYIMAAPYIVEIEKIMPFQILGEKLPNEKETKD